jgi:outer membrane protein assembly factor BamB
VVVLATLYEVIALDGSTGVRQWSHGRMPDHVADPGGDWEQGGAFRTHAVQDDVLLSVRDNGEIQSVAMSSGKVRWKHIYRPAAFGRVSLADPWVIYHVMQEGRTSLYVLDADTGLKVAEVVIDESRPVEDLFATIDGRGIVVTSRAISAYDLLTNAKLWSIELSGQIRPGSLAMDGSNLYFSDNGLDLQKVDLNKGAVEWQSERVADRGVDDLVVQLVGDSLLTSTPTSITGGRGPSPQGPGSNFESCPQSICWPWTPAAKFESSPACFTSTTTQTAAVAFRLGVALIWGGCQRSAEP